MAGIFVRLNSIECKSKRFSHWVERDHDTLLTHEGYVAKKHD